MSFVIDGSNAAGWAKYGDGTWNHFTGVKNSDGTFSITGYGNSTVSISGGTLTDTDSTGNAIHFSSATRSTYLAAGGPSK